MNGLLGNITTFTKAWSICNSTGTPFANLEMMEDLKFFQSKFLRAIFCFLCCEMYSLIDLEASMFWFEAIFHLWRSCLYSPFCSASSHCSGFPGYSWLPHSRKKELSKTPGILEFYPNHWPPSQSLTDQKWVWVFHIDQQAQFLPLRDERVNKQSSICANHLMNFLSVGIAELSV